MKEIIDYLREYTVDSNYEVEHFLILKRSDLLKKHKNEELKNISYTHFKEKVIYHSGIVSSKNFIETCHNVSLILFIDTNGEIKVLKDHSGFIKDKIEKCK